VGCGSKGRGGNIRLLTWLPGRTWLGGSYGSAISRTTGVFKEMLPNPFRSHSRLPYCRLFQQNATSPLRNKLPPHYDEQQRSAAIYGVRMTLLGKVKGCEVRTASRHGGCRDRRFRHPSLRSETLTPFQSLDGIWLKARSVSRGIRRVVCSG